MLSQKIRQALTKAAKIDLSVRKQYVGKLKTSLQKNSIVLNKKSKRRQSSTTFDIFNKKLNAKSEYVQQRNLHISTATKLPKISENKQSSFVANHPNAPIDEAISQCPFHAMVKKSNRRKSFCLSEKLNVENDFVPNFTKIQKRRHSVSAVPLTSHSILSGLDEIAKNCRQTIKDINDSFSSTLQKATRNFLVQKSTFTQSYSAIPGPKGLPLLGSVLDYTFLGKFSPRQFNIALKSRHSTYGKIFKERFLNEEFVYVSDPKDVQVLVQNEGTTPYRPSIEAIVESRKAEGLDVGITALQGEEWKHIRSAVNKVIMKPGAVTKFRQPQHEVTKDFIKFMQKNRSKSTGEIKQFDVWLNRWALESVAVVLLDTRLGLIGENVDSPVDPLAERLRKGMDVFFDYGARLAFNAPTWKIWNTKDWKIYRQCQKDEFETAGFYVDRKLKEIDSEQIIKSATDNKTESFLEHLVKRSKLERNESVTLCLELLAGGIDTSANAVVFTLYELARNKKHQDTLRQYIQEDRHLNNDSIAKGNSKSARFLRACVWESLRLHPLTYCNMRKTNTDLVMSGYKIPAGTTVRYTTHLMELKNPKYFKEPEKFIPDRWFDRKSDYRCTEQFVFTPFGHGARQCPGRRIAEQELDLLIRDIVKNFEVFYHHEDIGTKVRLFNAPDKEAKFSFQSIH